MSAGQIAIIVFTAAYVALALLLLWLDSPSRGRA